MTFKIQPSISIKIYMLLAELKGYKIILFYRNQIEKRTSFKVNIAKGMNQSSSVANAHKTPGSVRKLHGLFSL